ncbi:MAG TPA: glutaminyl-peptide cyclotransferase [Polyangiaceae bacterium]|nr:glutaminyl-peptide cyclotransferase [Polyangiaceae bacterium]
MAEALPPTVRNSTRRLLAPLLGVGLALVAGRAVAQTVIPRVEAVYPHDTAAFTEGLELFEGKLYESTGLNGRSTVRRVTLTTGVVEKSINLDSSLFGEGLTRIDRTLINLTYTTGVAIVFDLDTFAELKRFTYTGQGWGLCYDGTDLVMTNGTDKLFFRDPSTFVVRREVTVQRGGTAIDMLNELECVGSLVYINEWKTDNILRVDKATGNVLTLIDASALLTANEKSNVDVLNGIAYDAAKRRFYLTGKYWPKLFEVSFDFDPGGAVDGGVDAGTVDAGSTIDAGSTVDAAPPRDATNDGAVVDVATPRDNRSGDAVDGGARDAISDDTSSIDVGAPTSDASPPLDSGHGQGGAAGAGGVGGAAGVGGTADPEGNPTQNGCACRSGGACRSKGASVRSSWPALATLLGAVLLGRARRAARRR